MIYKEFKREKLSQLGFGCMRFTSDPETGEIDQAKVNAMFDLAIKNGVNYFDTAYPYLNGKSESAMAKALKRYPRESYYLADKFPGHSLLHPIDNRALFQVSLNRCQTDYFDFYLLHNITEYSIKYYEDEAFHILPDILKLKEEGKIRYLGFSFHGGNDLLKYMLDTYGDVFDFVQIQCNYLDWSLQHADEKYEMITEHGLGVWIMEPCRGGKLADLSPEDAARLKVFDETASPASFAFRFLQQYPNIRMILSGMNEVSQVEDNLRTFETFKPMDEKVRDTLFEIAEGMKQGVPCTRCRYCVAGCPKKLDIPFLIDCYNTDKVQVNFTISMRIDGLPEEKRPAACIGCGQCVHACPQGIHVPDVLAEMAEIYANGPNWHKTVESRMGSIVKDLDEVNS